MSETPPPLPRFSLVATCLGHAAIFSWAASTLPWRSGTSFAVTFSLLAILHVATAIVALTRKRAWLIWTWRALTVGSGLAFLGLSWSMAAAAIYVSRLYLRLGPSVASGIIGATVAIALLTLPIAIWGALHTLPRRGPRARQAGAGALLLTTMVVLALPLASSAAQAAPVMRADSALSSDLSDILEAHMKRPKRGKRLTVAGAGPAECASPIDDQRLTLLVAYVSKRGSARSACLQDTSARALRSQFSRLLRRKARAGSRVVVDLVKAVKPLSRSFPLLDALEVRPGLDGVCEDKRCLPAWQLTLSDVFSENRPLPSIPDVSYGFSAEAVRVALGSASVGQDRGIDGFSRIETESLAADAAGVHRLVRTRTPPAALGPTGVHEAVLAAQRYISEAQERDGTFRYAIDPASGREDKATLNLPRQAGTTYALCELGEPKEVKRTVRKALRAFRPHEKEVGEMSALSSDGGYGLGRTALPLLALLRCRDLVGAENDRLIGRLSRMILHLQRENGSFYPELDVQTSRGKGDHEILYAAGQAVLSLVLLEQQLGALKGTEAEPLPDAGKLKGALDRAMTHYGGPYWPTPLRDFFFFEEGWHCLAARTALTSHRNDAYERLCIDYVTSRQRFIMRESWSSEPNFVGGYGMSDLFPPRNTATAGVGEALNAMIAIKQKRGMPVDDDKARLRDLVSFLLRAQWSDAGCYACKDPDLVVGGFSQQLASPSIRIDYVQHAMAAVGHGGRLLFPETRP
jgi:hypothetical protein